MYFLNRKIDLNIKAKSKLKGNKGTLRSKGLQVINIFSLFLCLFSSAKVFALPSFGNNEESNSSQLHSSLNQESLRPNQAPSILPEEPINASKEQTNTSEDQTPLTKGDILNLIRQAEIKYHIPRGLLKSIAHIESGHNQYYLNVSGKPFKTKSAISALSIINQEIARGNNNIDIGVMQLNLRWHGSKFKDLKEMLDPNTNIEYGAKHLSSLKKEYGNWHKAVRIYHSSNPEYYAKYSRKVLLSWLQEK